MDCVALGNNGLWQMPGQKQKKNGRIHNVQEQNKIGEQSFRSTTLQSLQRSILEACGSILSLHTMSIGDDI